MTMLWMLFTGKSLTVESKLTDLPYLQIEGQPKVM